MKQYIILCVHVCTVQNHYTCSESEKELHILNLDISS